jgi:hypothetical protein
VPPSCVAEGSYSAGSVSFANHLGRDKEMARLLAACPMLDAHLALVVKTESGPATYARIGYQSDFRMDRVGLRSMMVAMQYTIDHLCTWHAC